MRRIIDGALRVALTGVYWLVRAGWFVRRPRSFGAHSLAFTPEGKVILVKLRYAPGWRVPGGGRPESEEPIDAALRELREEIGLISHGEVRLLRHFEESNDFKRDMASLVVVRDVHYQPHRWNWEVERVCEADLFALPDDMSPISARWIEEIRPLSS